MPDSASDDSFVDIGRDAALDQLKSVRKVLKSDAFQERVVEVVNDAINVPMVPEALEATAFDTVYDLVQRVSVAAVDRLIDGLKA
jgi:hypothetical protein